MASRIILDPETLLAQAGEMQSLTAEYESLFSKVTGTLNDTNNNWSELLAHNFAGKISSAQQSFASITELLASGAAAAKNSATTMQSVDQSLFKVFGGEAGEGIISGQVQGMTDVIEDYRKWEKKSKKVKAKSKKKKDGFLDSLKADMAGGEHMWFIFALLSAVFAALTSILAKVGINGVNSNLATAIRTVVVVIMAWGMVFLTNAQNGLSGISRKSWLFLILSGLATGASWLCYYKALQIGEASKVVPIDKLSVVITLILAFVFLHETFTTKSLIGCILIGAGTLIMVL